MKVNDIKNKFIDKYKNREIESNGTIEILGANFIADEDTIFGELNDYVFTELEWYLSMSSNVNDIQGKIPKIWQSISAEDGTINSNYGRLIFSGKYGFQFNEAIFALLNDINTRQSVMIYTRPTIYSENRSNECNDFICTFSTQLIVRNNKLHYFVNMRSNDAVFGYKNDRFWQSIVHKYALSKLIIYYPNLILGSMYWQANTLHVYERHFNLIEDTL